MFPNTIFFQSQLSYISFGIKASLDLSQPLSPTPITKIPTSWLPSWATLDGLKFLPPQRVGAGSKFDLLLLIDFVGLNRSWLLPIAFDWCYRDIWLLFYFYFHIWCNLIMSLFSSIFDVIWGLYLFEDFIWRAHNSLWVKLRYSSLG